jgi:glycerol-3-phosphate dehydrogenase
MQQKHELIILGGGISGLGVAQAAAELGISTLVLEASEIASATSNNTLRIIHGGFRYLQKLQFLRVIQSLRDQTTVATSFPDAVSPLSCLMPLKRFGLKSRLPVSLAALLYGAAMKLNRSPLTVPRVLSHKELNALAPELAIRAPYGALCWHDLIMTDPLALAKKLANQITQKGAVIQSNTVATSVVKDTNGYKVTTSTGEEFIAPCVVNTLGPWVRSLDTKPPTKISQPSELKWCLGFNLIISRQIHPTHAIAVESPDGRLFFAVPRGYKTAIGTWYTPCSAPLPRDTGKKPEISSDELEKFITSWNQAWPEQRISKAEITATDCGILPMRRDGPKGPELYGAEIINCEDGYCEVLSTKYTTFRSQGRRVMQRVVKTKNGSCGSENSASAQNNFGF